MAEEEGKRGVRGEAGMRGVALALAA